MYIDHSRIQKQFLLLKYSLSRSFLILSLRRILHTIYPPPNHPHPTPVDHPSLYLSTCPIRHPFQFSVSCGSQGSIVQRSSPHKCGQKSNCSAFNAVVVAFPQIFLDLLPSHMFMRHISTIEASWKVTLIIGLHTLNHIHQVRGGATPRTTFHLLPTYRTWSGNI